MSLRPVSRLVATTLESEENVAIRNHDPPQFDERLAELVGWRADD
jgi:hypothetical protein